MFHHRVAAWRRRFRCFVSQQPFLERAGQMNDAIKSLSPPGLCRFNYARSRTSPRRQPHTRPRAKTLKHSQGMRAAIAVWLPVAALPSLSRTDVLPESRASYRSTKLRDSVPMPPAAGQQVHALLLEGQGFFLSTGNARRLDAKNQRWPARYAMSSSSEVNRPSSTWPQSHPSRPPEGHVAALQPGHFGDGLDKPAGHSSGAILSSGRTVERDWTLPAGSEASGSSGRVRACTRRGG
jgi:hypothetical protein